MSSPEVVVAGIILNLKDEVLLCKSKKWRDHYVVPGGHVEFGESLEEALKREIYEETGLLVYDYKLVGIKENVFEDAKGRKRHMIVFDYECKTDCVNVRLNDEAESYIWIKEDDMFELPLDPYTRSFFEARQNQNSNFRIPILYNVS